MPMTAAPEWTYFECDDCGHVWKEPKPRTPPRTAGPFKP
jgi:hypothetical protein